ncbi:MAG: hypothetical protein HYS17_02030 [Micavibrio aeruginosavorus]|uniref:Uncharacterized protein n=1 Tax=Micavibrio aeruginosavorus TaxID=349221 RepID=A0A7T5UGT3_9BACT|nr:MAG: hypothetical protein HYS17_02030 [Micavibrio aeruginosavorus]
MNIEKAEITDLSGFLASRGGVADTFPQCGMPMPGSNGPSLMAARCQQDGQEFPMAKSDIGSLVAPSSPALKQVNRLG